METVAMESGGGSLRTELRVADAFAEFVVVTDRALFQQRLVKMGWQPSGDAGELVRRLVASGDIDRIFANFSRHVREMVLQSARLVPVRWEEALSAFLDHVEGTGLTWWLYGSGALAVRGLDIEPGDLDIAVDDATQAGDLLAELLVEPVSRHRRWVADWSGRAFHGAIIEWLADAHPSGRSLPHEQEPAAIEHLERVLWHDRPVPVPRLDLQLDWKGAQIFLYPSLEEGEYSRHRVGLQHISFHVPTRADVHRVHEWAKGRGHEIVHEPELFPEYHERFFATFFLDMHGFMLEAVSYENVDRAGL